MPKRVAVLAVDGGGIRGIIPAVILAELEQRMGMRCAEAFDLIAGTSTGGIIALGLTKPDPANPKAPQHAAKDLVTFYEDNGPAIFHHGFDPLKLIRSAYPAGPLEKALKANFGDVMVSQAVRDVLITSFDIQAGKVFMFKRTYAQKQDYAMWQAARATSAAPTYFPPYVVGDPGPVLVDGGVCVNDPAMCAYVEAVDLFGKDGPPDVLVVSVGTGDKAHRIGKDATDWGLIEWARPILDVVFDGVADAVDYQLKLLCKEQPDGPRYYRFQADMSLEQPPVSASLDDASEKHLKQLKDVAQHVIEANDAELTRLAKDLEVIDAAR
jgi:patatin-like phospholipase/acyl hydrolase